MTCIFVDAKLLIQTIHYSSHQTCICANRLLVQDKVFDEFSTKLVAAVDKLKVGNGMEASSTQGPLINQKAVEKVTLFTWSVRLTVYISLHSVRVYHPTDVLVCQLLCSYRWHIFPSNLYLWNLVRMRFRF